MNNKEYSKQYYEKNKAKVLEKMRQHYVSTKKKHNEYYSQYNKTEKAKEYHKEYRNKNKAAAKQYRIDNRVQLAKKSLQYTKNRLLTDPLFKLTNNIRALINSAFRRNLTVKSQKTTIILGCSFEEFKNHLEKQFDQHMTWDNYGSYWQIDHIKPISLAQSEQEIIALNHYTNLQPLEAAANREKSNKFN